MTEGELKHRIEDAYKKAAKDRDKVAISALRMLKASLKNAEIEKGHVLDDGEIISLVRKLINQREESVEAFQKGGRDDLVQKELQEIEVLKAFLPPELSKEELEEIVDRVIQEQGATSMKDMGKVMKAVMPIVQGRADGKTVNQMVRAKLGGKE